MSPSHTNQSKVSEPGSVQIDVAALVSSMTLDEKASLTAGVDMWTTQAVDRLGIPSWRMTDGPSGARGRSWGPAATRALALPTGSALGATWDRQLICQVGAELGLETRARAAQLLLGPTVNPQRAPLAGRTFECFSEDPLLSGVLGASYVRGVQGEGVAATVKHLAGNEAEWQRNSVDSIIDERTLREIYLLPFEWCVGAGAMAVMTSYNRLNGDHCTNHAWLLDDILRQEWGFEGVVMTDWWGIVDTSLAAVAGLDLEMPGPARAYGDSLARAITRGEIDETSLDSIVIRLLSTFGQLAVNHEDEHTRDNAKTQAFANHVSAESMVLVKNDHDVLPLAIDEMKTVAIIGPNAAMAQIMGGGSSQVRANHRIPPLDAMRTKWGERVGIVFEPGCAAGEEPTALEPWELTDANGEPGLLVEYWDNTNWEGDPVLAHHGDDFRIQYLGPPAEGINYPHFSARASATFTASSSGQHDFVLRSNAEARLIVDGVQTDEPIKPGDTDWFGAIQELRWSINLNEGQQIHFCVEFVNPPADTYGRTSLACARPVPPDALARAVNVAKKADAVIVVVGTTDLVESEGYDRQSLSLPDGQDELVERVCEANPRAVVVINSGGPVAMPWREQVPAVIQAWFGGQGMGNALADVLDGSAEPGGRMPFTVPLRIEDSPSFGNFPGEAGSIRYGEGLLIGHRWYDTRDIPVAVPFGHGGSYTTFDWGNVALVSGNAPGGVAIELNVTNSGDRFGSDVVQIYVEPPEDTPVFRPRRELKAFTKVHLAAGESQSVRIELDRRAFAYWTPTNTAAVHHVEVATTPFASTVPGEVPSAGWTVHPGTYRIRVARSITDLGQPLDHEVTAEPDDDGLLLSLNQQSKQG